MVDLLMAVLFLFVLIGLVPMCASFVQFLLVGLHGFRNNYDRCRDYTPQVAIIVPAWNEGDVIGATVDTLMRSVYPENAKRIYVVDDASTDSTPDVLREKTQLYPGLVIHLRREQGGQGKAHTLNHGLRKVLSEDWAQAVMIMDADVLFEPLTLRRMTRHLADPSVGAVTAYVKEGSHPGNLITRFIAFEYITAQAAARRAQNTVGVQACLAGGAQLHSRANLMAIGGLIDTSSLAADTFTTFKTQIVDHRVLFDGNAVVWAEEPDTLTALWKQRLRWARGNLQLTSAFRDLWFRSARHPRLGNFAFGVLWFSIVFIPLFMIVASIGLIALYYLYPNWASRGFGVLWSTTIVVYVFETLYSLVIDPATARRAWFEGLMFPGLISLGIMILFFMPPHMVAFIDKLAASHGGDWSWRNILTLFMYAWVSLCMLAAWGVYRLERAGVPDWLRNGLLLLVGYGPFMCAVAFAGMVAEWRGTEARWDKTVKSGKVRLPK